MTKYEGLTYEEKKIALDEADRIMNPIKRLREIKEYVEKVKSVHSTPILKIEETEWLIEQAELRQIDHQASVLANKINTAYTKEVMGENERLRETLEGLLHIEAVTQPNNYEELLKNVREYVVEALEQSP